MTSPRAAGGRSNAGGEARNAGDVAAMLLTCSNWVPRFVTRTVSVFVPPTKRLPKAIEVRDTSISGTPVTARSMGTKVSGEAGSLLWIRTAPR